MGTKKIFFTLLFLSSLSNEVLAQFGNKHEVGFFVSRVSFRTDYGQRNDKETNAGNTGVGFGIVHFMNFSIDERGYFTNDNVFNQHCRIRSEISYTKSDLEHFGKWVEGNPSLSKNQLKAMTGNTSTINFGSQLEFYPFNIRDFIEGYKRIAPFVGFGVLYSLYTTEAKSSLGELGSPATTFHKFLTPTDDRPHGFSNESKGTFSLVSSVGTRYKISSESDLFLSLRAQYFFSDWVDGLKPNPDLYKENKDNDWMVWFNLGYVYSIP